MPGLTPLTKKQSQDTAVDPKLMEDNPLKLDINKLNKEKEKKDATEAAGKRYCRVISCLKEIYPNRKCPGHGGGGGSDPEDDDENTAGYESEAVPTPSFEALTLEESSFEEEVSGWGSFIRDQVKGLLL